MNGTSHKTKAAPLARRRLLDHGLPARDLLRDQDGERFGRRRGGFRTFGVEPRLQDVELQRATLAREHVAVTAINEMNGTELDGRTIKVNEAEDKGFRGGRGGGRTTRPEGSARWIAPIPLRAMDGPSAEPGRPQRTRDSGRVTRVPFLLVTSLCTGKEK